MPMRAREYSDFRTLVIAGLASIVAHGCSGDSDPSTPSGPPSPVANMVPTASAGPDWSGILLIVPNGYDQQCVAGLGDDQSWNDLRADPVQLTSQDDDEGYLIEVLTQVQAALGHDAGRVFTTGASNGGMMSFRMLINRPEAYIGGGYC